MESQKVIAEKKKEKKKGKQWASQETINNKLHSFKVRQSDLPSLPPTTMRYLCPTKAITCP